MPELKAGDNFPEGITFQYVPYVPESADILSCGVPTTYDASKGKSSTPHSIPRSPKVFTPGSWNPACSNAGTLERWNAR